jgi:hypothetical protein
MWIDILIFVFTLLLSAEVLWVFQMVRKLNDSELQSACAGSGPSMTFKQKSISNLIGGNNPIPGNGDLPASDLTVTAQLNCEQDA